MSVVTATTTVVNTATVYHFDLFAPIQYELLFSLRLPCPEIPVRIALLTSGSRPFMRHVSQFATIGTLLEENFMKMSRANTHKKGDIFSLTFIFQL